MAAQAEKAELPHGSPLVRNGRGQGCAFGVGEDCPRAPLTTVADHLICPNHIELLRAIATDAGVPFDVEVAAA